ncbi:type II toxin-antitoxin system HicB family antitoxin [Methylobacterium sp. J-067]|uniref:type II toxin-antitoxin system HicB family antitoxin n=1 Tax=Methylobacterium sp. J-067 TaxID=2836648 RepID=UPI001FBAD8CB|nr:type II toxin-antitoxin system HicB family antitoxin [Methylobacterium sp. J-067]MCJ2026170.1 type II toxin-antitoxin system HicB family antitoxin [Methylobacterium sp. J-067]
MNTMSHKGLHARVEFDAEDGLFVGRIAGIDDVVGFHGESVSELKAAFQQAVDDYIETCLKSGKEPERAYSGKLMLRVSPDLHARAARAAELSGKSLNQWGEDVLRAATAR